MKDKQIEIIENCIELLKSTLGTMDSRSADKVVDSVSKILEVVASNLKQLK